MSFDNFIHRWYKEDQGENKAIQRSNQVLYLSGSLFLYDVDVEDSAVYACVVQNSVGSRVVKTNLIITGTPFINQYTSFMS